MGYLEGWAFINGCRLRNFRDRVYNHPDSFIYKWLSGWLYILTNLRMWCRSLKDNTTEEERLKEYKVLLNYYQTVYKSDTTVTVDKNYTLGGK
jgi:hypothetical protein